MVAVEKIRSRYRVEAFERIVELCLESGADLQPRIYLGESIRRDFSL